MSLLVFRRKQTTIASFQGTTMTVQEEEVNTNCKWGPVKSTCCNRLANIKVVLLCLSFASVVQGMVVNGFVNVGITSLEKRFNLPSKDSGLIASAYDIATVICLLPTGYFGGQGSKPRWIGFGMLILAAGSFVFALPHFLTGLYRYEVSSEDQYCNTADNITDTCKDAEGSVSNYKYVLILGQVLLGIGSTPLFTLGLAYMDEHLTPDMSALYLGIFYAVTILGPALGFLLGGYFIDMFTDFDQLDKDQYDITAESDAWVGAWWVGPLLCSALALLVAIPILGLPKRLPGWKELEGKKSSEVHKGQDDIMPQYTGIKSLKDFPRITKSLLINPTFMFLSLAGASDALIIIGFAVFAPKYMETQFNISASTSSIIVGAALVVFGTSGSFVAGFIIKRCQLRLTAILKMLIALSVLNIVLYLNLLPRCPTNEFAGISLDYSGAEIKSGADKSSLRGACNVNCNCAFSNFDPVCGNDGVTYFNPCVAGCLNKTDDDKEYQNCTCVGDDGVAMSGSCAESCNMLYIFIPMYAVSVFLTFMTFMPLIPATLRCVPELQRSFALCVQDVIIRPLGTIPGPIVIGAIIDQTCRFWLKPSCSNDDSSACYYYDQAKLSYYLLAMTAGVKLLSVFFYFLSHCLYKPPTQASVQTTVEANTRF